MRVDVVDRVCRKRRALQSLFHRSTRSASRRIGLGEMVIVRRDAIAADFGQNSGATRECTLQILKRKDRRAFSENHPCSIPIKWPALFWRRGLQRIETNEN